MIITIEKYFIAAVLFSFTHGTGKTGVCNTTAERGAVVCCFNYYWNGDICLECPGGYFGNNCSSSCPPSRYGTGCSKKCNCSNSLCHHIYGCNNRNECSPGFAGDNCIDPCPYPRYGAHCNDTCDCSNSSCHHVHGCSITTFTATDVLSPGVKGTVCMKATTRENNGTDKKEGSRTQQISKLIIITSGVLISTGLLLLIGREIYHKFRMSQVHQNRQTLDDSPEDFNIYAEINAPSRGNVIIQQLR